MSSSFVFYDDDRPVELEERRSGERVPIETEVSLESDSTFFAGLTRNLSTGGVFIATYRLLAVGCRVALRITLPDGEIYTKGTVRWRRDARSGAAPGLGVAFDELDPLVHDRVARFCALREPLLHEPD